MSLGEFEEKQQVQDAVLRRIEIIGEAVKNLPEDLRRENPLSPRSNRKSEGQFPCFRQLSDFPRLIHRTPFCHTVCPPNSPKDNLGWWAKPVRNPCHARFKHGPQLPFDGKRDEHLWAETYDGTVEDVFGMQDQVSQAIVDALRVELSPNEAHRFTHGRFPNFQAFQFYPKLSDSP